MGQYWILEAEGFMVFCYNEHSESVSVTGRLLDAMKFDNRSKADYYSGRILTGCGLMFRARQVNLTLG